MSSLRPSFMGIESMKQTLFSAQKALDITGNNISNVNTVGYSRQRADQVSLSISSNSLYFNTSKSLAGQGAATSGITQLRDKLLDERYRDLNSGTALASVCKDTLTDVENVIDVIDTTGFYGIFGKFKDALSQFGTDNTDRKELANVSLQYAKQMCQALKNYDSQINQLAEGVKLDAQTSVDKVNSILEEIYRVNDQIKNAYVSSGDIIVDSTQDNGYKANTEYGPNELKDQLNELVDELSTYGNVDMTENADGTYNVDFANHSAVTSNETFRQLEIKYDENDGSMQLFFNDGNQITADEQNLASGALRGYLDMYNGGGVYAAELGKGYDSLSNGIAYYREMMNALANTMATAYNKVREPGSPMFQTSDGSAQFTAANVSVSDEWKADAMLITYDPATDAPTPNKELDNTWLNRVKSVSDQKLDFTRTTGGIVDQTGITIDDYVSYYSNKLGQDISYSTSVYKSYDSMALSVANQRDSVMGVSLDEEGANLMTYQKWYNASARMMTALDEALNTIINGMGLVGR